MAGVMVIVEAWAGLSGDARRAIVAASFALQ